MAGPAPSGDYRSIIEQLQPLGPQATQEWLDANASLMEPAVARFVISYFAEQPVQGGGSYINEDPSSPTQQLLSRLGGTVEYRGELGADDEASYTNDLTARAGEILVNGGTNFDQDNNGKLDKYETAARDKAVKDQAKLQADAKNTNPADEEETLRGGILAAVPIPDTLRQYLGSQGSPSPEQQRLLIDNWNRLNPDQKIAAGDIAGLYTRLGRGDADAKGALDATFFGIDPVQQYRVTLADGRSVLVDADEFSSFQTLYGLQSHEMTQMIRSAGRVGITDHNDQVAFQMLAPLVRAMQSIQTKDPIDYLNQKPQVVSTGPTQVLPGSPVGQGANDLANAANAGAGTLSANQLDKVGLKFKEGQYVYQGNDFLAYLHALNPALAARMAGNPEKFNPDDVARTQQLMLDGKFSPEQLANMGYASLGLEDWAARKGYTPGGGGGSGPTRMIADQDALRQAAVQMYRAMFADEPSESEIQKLMSAANGAVAGAAPNESVDVQAKITAQLQKNGKYKEFYANRPDGMSEEEYQQQFRQGAASMVGAEAVDPTAIQSGMRTGDFQTTIGQVAGQKKSWGNSTFLGRLAQAAQLVSENT